MAVFGRSRRAGRVACAVALGRCLPGAAATPAGKADLAGVRGPDPSAAAAGAR